MSSHVNGGQALVAALAAHDVRTVFGIPGTHNLSVYAALAEHGIRTVASRHEQGAGYAADGYARVAGRPGVCLTTTGPAALNAAAAAAQAQSDSVPVLFVAPGLPSTHPGRGNGLLHEVIDQRAAFAGIVEHTHRVRSVAEIPSAVAEAFAAMTHARPRPAYLEIPLDLLLAEGPLVAVAPLPKPRRSPDDAAVSRAARLLRAAESPLIIAGGGATTAAESLRSLAERLGAPVVMTANGKAVLAEDHELAVGTGLQHAVVAELAAASDVVLAVGTELSPADLWYGPLVFGGQLVRIDVDPHRVIANAVPEVALVGDAHPTLAALVALLPDVSPSAQAKARADDARREFRAQANKEGAPYLALTEALEQALGRDGILAGDSTMACYYGALSNMRRYRPRGFLYPTGGGTLGYGLPAGIGAKLAAPDLPVVVLHGDGGLMFSVAELAAAADLRLPLPVVVVDNGGYGEIRNEMRDRADPVHGVDLTPPALARLANSLGCRGVDADDATIAGALRDALAADRPTVIHLRVHAERA